MGTIRTVILDESTLRHRARVADGATYPSDPEAAKRREERAVSKYLRHDRTDYDVLIRRAEDKPDAIAMVRAYVAAEIVAVYPWLAATIAEEAESRRFAVTPLRTFRQVNHWPTARIRLRCDMSIDDWRGLSLASSRARFKLAQWYLPLWELTGPLAALAGES